MLGIQALTVAQQIQGEPPKTKEDLLQKSKTQKTSAYLLLGIGAAATIGGAILFDDNFTVLGEGDNDVAAGGVVLIAAGGLSMLGSIPLFIASSNNKARAMAMSAGIKVERSPSGVVSAFPSTVYPAIAVKFQLRH